MRSLVKRNSATQINRLFGEFSGFPQDKMAAVKGLRVPAESDINAESRNELFR